MSVRPLIGFDLDGTLEDSRADMTAAVHRVRAGLGLLPRDDAAIAPHLGRGMPELYARCFDDAQPEHDVKARYEADYLAHVADHTRLYPGIAEALAALQEKATLVVLTNKPETISRRLLDLLGVGHRFSAVVGGDTCAEAKPSPLVFERAARVVGFPLGDDPGHAPRVHVGDSAGDIQLARAVGAASIWCAWGYAAGPGEVAPDWVAEAPVDLVGLAFEAVERLSAARGHPA